MYSGHLPPLKPNVQTQHKAEITCMFDICKVNDHKAHYKCNYFENTMHLLTNKYMFVCFCLFFKSKFPTMMWHGWHMLRALKHT